MRTFVNGAITQQCVSTAAALLEKFGRISLYVTADAIACDVKFSRIERNDRNFRIVSS